MTEPKPMDPERLATLERIARASSITEEQAALLWVELPHLLDDRDRLETEAERARVERDGAMERAKLLLESKNEWMDRAVAAEVEAERLRASLLAVAVFAPDGVATLRNERDILRSRARQLMSERDRLSRDLDDARREALEARNEKATEAAIALVTDEDIRAAGLGDPDVCEDCPRLIAWIAAKPGLWLVDGSNDGYDPHGVGHLRHGIWGGGDPRKDPDAILVIPCSPMAHDHIINAIARVVGRAPLDVLAEIAAMPAEADHD